MFGTRGIRIPYHVFYVDDVMICCWASKSSVTSFMIRFHYYENAFGQVTSNDKSKIYKGSLSMDRVFVFLALHGFHPDQLPFIYLVVFIYKGKPQKEH